MAPCSSTARPRFLVSDEFHALDAFKQNFKNQADAMHTAQHMGESMSLEYVLLYHPMGHVYFKDFLYQHAWDGPGDQAHLGDELFELLLEIDDYTGSGDVAHRQARAKRILMRFRAEELGLGRLANLAEKVEANPDLMEKAAKDMFREIRTQCIEKLDRDFYRVFQETRFFDGLKENVSMVFNNSTTFDVDPELGSGRFEKKGQRRVGRTGSLIRFAEERQLQTLIKDLNDKEDQEVSLEDILAEPHGLFFFKKFSRANFMEECILFCLEAEHFQSGEHSKPQHGTVIFCGDAAEVTQLRRDKIISKYIAAGSRMEVNIPASIRDKILTTAEEATTPLQCAANLEIFLPAYGEIKQLVKANLWAKFLKSKHYSLYIQKMKIKMELQVYSQGHGAINMDNIGPLVAPAKLAPKE